MLSEPENLVVIVSCGHGFYVGINNKNEIQIWKNENNETTAKVNLGYMTKKQLGMLAAELPRLGIFV